MILAVDGESEAIFGLIDKPKDDATLSVAVLIKSMGVKAIMLTGDDYRTARAIASEIGISSVIAGVLPEGKVDSIKNLQKEGHCVGMVGDGFNDSPALAQADIGIAMGAGTDVAIETAGVVLVNSRVSDVVVTLHLARTIYSRIRWNFAWALGYNTLAIPIAAGVLYPATHYALPPHIATLAMVLSSFSVLISSLLLNRYRPPIFEKIYGRLLRQGRLGLEH